MPYALLTKDRAGRTVVREIFGDKPVLHDSLDVRQVEIDVVPGHVLHDNGRFGPMLPTREELAAYAAARRWRAQVAGTASGLATDEASRQAIMGKIASIDLGIVAAPVVWKTGTAWINASRQQLVEMAQAIEAHVQAAFAAEAQVAARIAAGTITTFDQIDAAAWPA